MDSTIHHLTVSGESLHYRTGLEIDSKETEKLLEEPSEEENGKPRALTDTSTHWEHSTEWSVASATTRTSVLAAPKDNTCRYSFLRFFYPSSDGKVERISPFAVALLIVLLAVYVLNQADRLVLAVVIPNGLRCGVGKDACTGSNSTTNITTNVSDAERNSSEDVDCIRFSDDQQGLLTGIYYVMLDSQSMHHSMELEKSLISQVQRSQSFTCWLVYL